MVSSPGRPFLGALRHVPTVPADSPPRPGQHLPALDGLRGLAVLMVVVFHVFQVEAIPTQASLRVLYMATRLGQTGVDLFFVLSGFLITGILFDAKGSSRYFLNFYGRRTLRIFPLYYGILIAALLIVPQVFGIRVSSVDPVWLWTYTANLPLAFGADGGTFGYFWTLAIEEQFYLVWPAVVCFADRKTLMKISLGCIAGAAVSRVIAESAGISSFCFTLCRMDSLGLGAFLALAIRRPEGTRNLGKVAAAILLATLVVMAPCYAVKTGGGDAWVQVIKYTVTAVFYGALLILAISSTERSWLGRVFCFAPLREVGRLSYGMYMYHTFVIHFAAWMLSNGRLATWGIPSAGALWVRFGAIFALSLAVSWLSWRCFERPFLNLKKYFEFRPKTDSNQVLSGRLSSRAERPIFGAD